MSKFFLMKMMMEPLLAQYLGLFIQKWTFSVFLYLNFVFSTWNFQYHCWIMYVITSIRLKYKVSHITVENRTFSLLLCSLSHSVSFTDVLAEIVCLIVSAFNLLG